MADKSFCVGPHNRQTEAQITNSKGAVVPHEIADAVECPGEKPYKSSLCHGEHHPSNIAHQIETTVSLAVDVQLRHGEQCVGSKILLEYTWNNDT